ncbi:MAG: PH domain-containing protein [Acidobacteriota bacterium]
MSEPPVPASPPLAAPASVERQLHPLSWVFESVRNLRGAITAAFFIFFVQQGSVGPRFFFLFLAPFLFFTGVVGPLLRYLTFRYRLEEEELVLRRGVLSRNERRLAYSRVQNIDLVENPFHRAFGLAVVKIETASGGKAEATMHLSPAAVEELRQRIFAHRQSGEAADPATEGAPLPEPSQRKTLLKLDVGEVVRLGLIQNRGMVLVAAAFGLFFQQSFIDWETFGRWISRWAATADVPSVEASPFVLVVGGALLIGVWLVLLALLSIAFALLRFAHFELSRDGEDLRARFGLLTRVAMTVPRRRVQRVWSTQTLLHRLFGRISIRLDTAGGGQDDGATGRHWLAPVGRPEVLSPLILEALPDLDAEPLETWPGSADEHWQPIVRRSWKRLFRRWTVLSGLVLVLPVALTSFYWLLLLLVPLALVYRFVARRTIDSRYYALTEDAILTRSGWLSRTLSIVRFEKIQAVAFRQSPFDRRHGTGSIHIDTAGSSLGSAVSLDFIDETDGVLLAEMLHREAATRTFRWS